MRDRSPGHRTAPFVAERCRVEPGIFGAGAAVGNAVDNACGVPIREFPMTLDKVIAGLENSRKA